MKLKLLIFFTVYLFVNNIINAQVCNNINADFCVITEGSTTHFSFSGSEDGVSSYLWDFGDGNTSSLQNPVHTFLATGSFQACLTLTCVITTGGGGYGGGGNTTTCVDSHCNNILIGVNGCTDALAVNYNTLATIDDGSCDYCINGCTDALASNFNPLATCDDNSCFDINIKSVHEDFEIYNIDDYLAFTSSLWQTWSDPFSFMCLEDVKVETGVLDSNLNGGSNAIGLKSTNPSGGPQDIVMPFGTTSFYNSGVFIFSSKFNVNTGGYFNFQSDYNIGAGWALDVVMQQNGQMVFYNSLNNSLLTANFPQNTWFELKIAVNISANEWHVYLDNVFVGFFSNGINQIAALDLFPLDGHLFWVDDIHYSYNANLIYGCTDSNSVNYNIVASWDDGTCIPIIEGCTDSTMFNYNVIANTDDGSCIPVVIGCMDSLMWNYDQFANIPSGNCIPFIFGCTDPLACNYDSLFNTDDNSCDMPYGCGDTLYIEYSPIVTCSDSNSCATLIINGCMDINACNYNLLANINDGNCSYNSVSYDSLSTSNSIVWNGINISISGDYSVTLINNVGCDSITNLNITINSTTNIIDKIQNHKRLIKVINVLGQETKCRKKMPLFYIYNDGTVERRIILK